MKMKKSVENLYNIKKMKTRVNILTIAMAIFGLLTILLVFGSIYHCEMKVYKRTVVDGQEEVSIMVFDKYNENYEYEADANTKKITFSNMAFGLNIDEENLGFIPVEQDTRFLLLFLAQAIIYLFIFANFKVNNNLKFILKTVGAGLLLVLAIIMIIFFNNYGNEIEQICKQAIEQFRTTYPNLGITSTVDTSYPSRVEVGLSPLVGISTAFMIVSSGICLYTALLNKSIYKMECENAK